MIAWLETHWAIGLFALALIVYLWARSADSYFD